MSFISLYTFSLSLSHPLHSLCNKKPIVVVVVDYGKNFLDSFSLPAVELGEYSPRVHDIALCGIIGKSIYFYSYSFLQQKMHFIKVKLWQLIYKTRERARKNNVGKNEGAS